MSSTTLSRLGRAPGSGAKEPCDAVSQGSPITRSGLYTLGGVALLPGMRVFDKDAANPTEIGIYIVDAGPWPRAPDWNKDDDIRSGVIVAARSANGVTETYQITFMGDHRIGTTEYVVTRFDVNAGTLMLEYGRIFADTYLAAVTIAALPGILDGTVFEIATDETAPAPYTNKPYLYTKTGGVLVPTGPALAPGAIGFARSTTPEAALPATVSDMNAAMQYLEGYIRANAYNALDPKWGIVQKLTTTPAQSVRAELQALLDFAETRRNVTADLIYKGFVYLPGAQYKLDGPLYVANFNGIIGDLPQYGSYGTVLVGLNGFNGGAGGDLLRVKSAVDPTSGESFWGGTIRNIGFLGSPDGLVQYGFNTVNQTGASVELQDTADLDFLSGNYLSAGGIRLYGGVPAYIRRPRFLDCNGPAIDLISNGAKHNITHILEPSCDQCHNGVVRLTNWADGDVCVITGLKSERADSTHGQNFNTGDAYWPLVAGWKDAGHDGQKNAIYIRTPQGGQIDIRGAHHISAWNAKQLATYSVDVFTLQTKSEMVDGTPVRAAANTAGNVFSNPAATLPTGLTAGVDYFWKSTGLKTGKLALTLGTVNTGPYVTPSAAGVGTFFLDPGYLSPGDLVGWDGTGQLPDINWSGAYIRYRPFASGGVERIGSAPNIMSSIPVSDPSDVSPRFENFRFEASSGRVMRADIGVAEVASNNALGGGHTRRSVRMLGVTNYPATNSALNEDSVFVAGGKIPAFMLYDVDAAADQKIVIMRSNGGTWQLTKINDDGTFTNLLTIGSSGDITILNGGKINLGAGGTLPIVSSGSRHIAVVGSSTFTDSSLAPDAVQQLAGAIPAYSLYETDGPVNQKQILDRMNGGIGRKTGVRDDGSIVNILSYGLDASGNPVIGAYGALPLGSGTITGSRGGNAALASLLTYLAARGWFTDGTTA